MILARKQNYIIFDHLVPTSPHLKEFPDWYVTDLVLMHFNGMVYDGIILKILMPNLLKILKTSF